MSKTLILAEKPSVARDIARVLKCQHKGNGYLEGDRYVVTWALGHLVELADPEAYGDYSSWRLEDLPILPKQLELVIIKQSGKQYQAVKTQLHRKDINQIIIATDAGREGELVARWILAKAKNQKPLKRLWISSVTDKAIRDGMNKLRDGKEFEKLYASAEARAEADWFVGINASRALTCKHNAQLSCGRVQTPTVALVAERETMIKAFRPQKYFGMVATCEGLKLTWQDGKSGDTRSFKEERIDDLVKQLMGKAAQVMTIDKVGKKSYAPKLYDLTELQRDGNKLFGFSAKETLAIMQRLYEQHKLVTYPRTDSRYISSDIVDTLADRVRACQIKPYTKLATKLLRQPLRSSKNFVDDSQVSDHHAIIPTEETAVLTALNDKERKIYDLIVKRFLAVLFPPFEYEQTIIKAKIGTETFVARGKTVLSLGWKEVYENKYEDEEQQDLAEQLLPKVDKGANLNVRSLAKTSGSTKPPEPFTEGTLLSAMETGRLGTVATRADIIEKLFNSFLIEKQGKHILITSKGKQLLELVPEELKSPALTAEWEQQLEAIAQGKLAKNQFVKVMMDYAKDVVHDIKGSNKIFKHDNLTGNRCPECGKLMLEVNGKRGKMLVCQDRECGHRKLVSKSTNARCPNCHKRLDLVGEGEGQIFICKCGYKEKLSAFNARRQEEKGKNVSKRDVARYLKDQKQTESAPMNTALADALAKLKL